MHPRLFLVAPESPDDERFLACASAAVRAADCASIVVAEGTGHAAVAALQGLGLAVLLKDAEPRDVFHLKADGLLLSSLEHLAEARKGLKTESLGFIAGTSRHLAMEAAEAGADVVCFTQTKQRAGEPIIGWWQDVTEVPAVAFDPVSDATLKPQKPDFIRPPDAMWSGAQAAAKVVTELMSKWQA